jgi:hypothetical protein
VKTLVQLLILGALLAAGLPVWLVVMVVMVLPVLGGTLLTPPRPRFGTLERPPRAMISID